MDSAPTRVAGVDDLLAVQSDTEGTLLIWIHETDTVEPRELCPDCSRETWRRDRFQQRNVEHSDFSRALRAIRKNVEGELAISYQSEHSPLIAVRGTPANMRTMVEVLAAQHDVSMEFWSPVHFNDLSQSIALGNTRIGYLFNTGSNVRVGWVERYGADPGHVDYQYVSASVAGRRNNCIEPNGGQHALSMMGVMSSTRNDVPGGAVDADVYIAPVTAGPTCADVLHGALYVENFFLAVDWAVSNDVDIINVSADINSQKCSTAFTLIDRYVDYVAANSAVLFSLAAGNEGNSDAGRCATEGGAHYVSWKSWNGLTVGASDDGTSTSWSDDATTGFSSWRNFNSLRESPDVVAPGQDVITLTADPAAPPWASGTSVSAPIVTSHAARLLVQSGFNLQYWPEGLRAVIVAGAVNRTGESPGWKSPATSSADFRFGAGAVSGQHEYYLTDTSTSNGNYWRGSLSESGWSGGSVNLHSTTWTFSANAGKNVRIAFAWNARSSCSAYTSCSSNSSLERRYEIWLYGPSGTLLEIASEDRGSIKLLERAITTTGTYTIRIRRSYKASGSTYSGEFAGLAWLIY